MENNSISILNKKKQYEYKKMNELDEQWFNENIDFETSIKIREEYELHKKKYKFYRNLIESLKKGANK